jgi:hypothetical protein
MKDLLGRRPLLFVLYAFFVVSFSSTPLRIVTAASQQPSGICLCNDACFSMLRAFSELCLPVWLGEKISNFSAARTLR